MAEYAIRDARDDDGWDIIGVVAESWAEYPGCVMDVHGEVPELLALATHYAALGGRSWVAEMGGRAVASAAIAPAPDAGVFLLQKLYVAHAARRRGIGSALLARVEDEARARGGHAVELWSDTRFGRAHRFYEGAGYARLPDTRELHDLSRSVEYRFRKEV